MRHQHLWNRRRLIRDTGRPAQLSRLIPRSDPPAFTTVTVQAFSRGLVPETAIRGAVEAGSLGVRLTGGETLEILDDEMTAALWPSPPRRNDTVIWDGQQRAVDNAKPVFEGTNRIGWTLFLRS